MRLQVLLQWLVLLLWLHQLLAADSEILLRLEMRLPEAAAAPVPWI